MEISSFFYFTGFRRITSEVVVLTKDLFCGILYIKKGSERKCIKKIIQ